MVISGPLRAATVYAEQLDLHTGAVYIRIGDTITDDDGRFAIDTGHANGLLRITVRGGAYVDAATRVPLQLDPTDELTSLVWFDLAEVREDLLVSPIGHLIATRARMKLELLGDMTEAMHDATDHLGRHFGDVKDWSRLRLASLDQPATSPTEEVRAALVHTALSYLAQDIATEAGSSPQEINVFRLMQRWAADLARAPDEGHPVFDGNDDNDRRAGSGLQLGTCAPIAPVCQVPVNTCNTGHCRSGCDLYVGTPRSVLAGVMTKVIRDNGPGGANQTGLRIQDTLAIARSVSDNVDPDLFANACIETLDRTAPDVRWDEAHSAAADAVVRGAIQMKAVAVDDVDAKARVQIVGHTDVDGDPFNEVALASIDTGAAGDGPLIVTAQASDLAGNSKAIERRLIIDNTPPQLALSVAGFVEYGGVWWTASEEPALTGTFVDDHPASVKATIGGQQIAGTLAGSTWSVPLPVGNLPSGGADVTITLTDRAGNQVERTQRIRRDATPPALSLQPSIVTNEAAEAPAFAPDESPIHSHNGTPIDLAVSGACPVVIKYSYLLGAVSPPHVTETPTRNPLAYQLVAADDGIGIVDGSTEYRVLRREASGSTVVLGWTSAGAGTPIAPGARLFPVAIVSDLVAGLAAVEATYDVELRARDGLSRTASTSRCFELRLKAPPLHFTEGGVAAGHSFALNTLSLAPGAPYDQLAARLLNDDATGASLLDQKVINGTTETVYLTVNVTKPSLVTASQSFEIRNYASISDVDILCYDDDDEHNPACLKALDFPSAGYPLGVSTGAVSTNFPVKLYELNSAGVPATEISCLAPCTESGDVFKFAVPPRAVDGAARRFIAMTMIGRVTNLWPSDVNRPALAPFSDSVVAGVRYTGRSHFASTGCYFWTSGDLRCKKRIVRNQYRALKTANLMFHDNTFSEYSTAATAQLNPTEASPKLKRPYDSNWSTAEGVLP